MPTSPTPSIDLGRAIEAYTSSLVDRLRGFAAGTDVAPFLERWVHDEDLGRSLVSMAEAAAEAGLERFVVHVDAGLAPRVNPAALASLLPGSLVDAQDGALSITVDVAGAQGASRQVAKASVAPATRRVEASIELDLPFLSPEHLPALNAAKVAAAVGDARDGDWLGATTRDDATWRVGVRQGKVASASVQAEASARPEWVRFLSFAGQALLGLPLREARDHGAGHVELALRGRGPKVPVKGIWLPSRAGTAFRTLQELLDELAKAHAEDFGAPKGWNEWLSPPGRAWQFMNADERLTKVRAVVAKVARTHGLEPEAVPVRGIAQEILVHVAHPDVAGSGAKGQVLMSVERALRDELDPALVVTTDERPDGNKLRRLTVSKES